MATKAGFPTTPEDFGRELRRMRESSGLSTEDIAAETKISPRILRSLEEGKFQYLPDKVFSRNFVRQYGAIIGLDEDRLAEAFEAAWERFEEMSGSHPVLLAIPPAPRRSIRWSLVIPATLAAAGLIVAIFLVWQTWRRPAELPGFGAGPSPSPVSSPAPPSPTSVVVAVRESPTAAPEKAPDDGSVSFSIHVRPLAECWFRYRDAMGRTSRELVDGGNTRSFELVSPVRLTLGNAGAVSMEVAGERYTELGRDGQVVHLEVTPEGLRRLQAGQDND